MTDKLVTLATLTFSRAQILKARLEDAEIECFLDDVNVIRSSVSGAVKVQVTDNVLKNALRIALQLNEELGEDELLLEDVVDDISKILVPVDFSVYSKNACEYALGIAERLKADIMLFHAYYFNVAPLLTAAEPYSYQITSDQSLIEIKELAEENMSRIFNHLKTEISDRNIEGVQLNYNLVHGVPEEEIIEFCAEYKPGVIIMGTGDSSKSNDIFFGSVTSQVIEEAKVPVLTIPKNTNYGGINRTNILYATNFEKSDVTAIRKLMTLIYLFDVKLYCVHIGSDDLDSVLMENLKNHFEKNYAGYNMDCALINGKDVIKELQHFVDEKNIDIVAMTTHKRNFFSRIFNPSLTRKVLFHTNTPLLVFHA
jgi:nucleotide-binding universal stress UspA family protein